MKVIGVGLGRTGTTSIQRALQELGYTAYNFEAVIHNRQFDAWREVTEGKEPDWSEIFAGYDATISWPACFYYKELQAAYPRAKFILTTRDSERWAESVSRVHQQFAKLKSFRFIPRVRAMTRLMDAMMLPRLGGSRPDKKQLMALMEQHNSAVEAHFSASDQFLIYEVKDGWEPLCEFLGHPVPDKPFPYENQGDQFIKQAVNRFIRGN